MGVKRENERFLKKLPVEVSADNYAVKGTTVRISEKGFFVRAQKVFSVGTPVDIILSLTEERSCRLKGIVKFAERSAISARQNGMGIELTEKSPEYAKIIRSFHH
ncbi:MAG TPA: PilZ domain-containing protein [Thermodesulfovibrionales bacterium]|nr:PilZ domain-containing protein [Thermodesulfovibrionales bacterium]